MINPRIRVFFSIISFILILTFLYDSTFVQKWSMKKTIHKNGVKHKYLSKKLHEKLPNTNTSRSIQNDMKLKDLEICSEFFDYKGYKTKCEFLQSNPDCTSGGFFNYVTFFYCDCQNLPFLGYFILVSWLAILFYMLGSTASDYFCCSLENLSTFLKMSPTIAGVTLLPLGNGASDVFSSIAAFMGTGSGDVGLNGVLGACVFITCVVVGVISISVSHKMVQIDKKCFIRDIGFLLFTIFCLTVIMFIGEITIWGALGFLSIYLGYIVFIFGNEILRKKGIVSKSSGFTLLVVVSHTSDGISGNEFISSPLLSPVKSDELSDVINSGLCIHHGKPVGPSSPPDSTWGWSEEEEYSLISFSNLCWLLEAPLNVPRQLTIPIIDSERWSKMYAIASTFLSPVLLAYLWNTRESINPLNGKIAYLIGFSLGLILSILTSIYTKTEHPPRKFLFPWIIGGFSMSMIWFYIVADELVSLIVSLGTILGINPSMLALTVLAWGNSMIDLMSNTAFAMNDNNGVQIAMSGCYAGPMFNTLIGLGVSLVLGTWSLGSDPYLIPRDSGLFFTVGFLTFGLIWALIVLPRSDMRPNKVLGVGLIVIYVLFLSIRISLAISVGSFNSLGWSL